MKGICTLLLCGWLATITVSCAYNSEEELYPLSVCDTTNVSYATTIVPILEAKCYDCHAASSPSSGIPLEGYDNIKVKIDQERLIGAIRHLPGFSPMPQIGELTECEIRKIESWVDDGALPN